VLARGFDQGGVEHSGHDLFLIVAGLGENAAEGVGDKAAAPEVYPRFAAAAWCVVAGPGTEIPSGAEALSATV